MIKTTRKICNKLNPIGTVAISLELPSSIGEWEEINDGIWRRVK